MCIRMMSGSMSSELLSVDVTDYSSGPGLTFRSRVFLWRCRKFILKNPFWRIILNIHFVYQDNHKRPIELWSVEAINEVKVYKRSQMSDGEMEHFLRLCESLPVWLEPPNCALTQMSLAPTPPNYITSCRCILSILVNLNGLIYTKDTRRVYLIPTPSWMVRLHHFPEVCPPWESL